MWDKPLIYTGDKARRLSPYRKAVVYLEQMPATLERLPAKRATARAIDLWLALRTTRHALDEVPERILKRMLWLKPKDRLANAIEEGMGERL